MISQHILRRGLFSVSGSASRGNRGGGVPPSSGLRSICRGSEAADVLGQRQLWALPLELKVQLSPLFGAQR